ncbi:MAG: hypothetical protein IJL98_09735 [Lachnospiraceae bacterium]|nr:hypothetical protein [Lachnospiraceae bacterium]
MNQHKSKLTRYLLLALLFIIIISGVLLAAILRKNDSGDQYQRMQEASLPLLSMALSGTCSTELHGYVDEMNLLDMRDVIAPLSENKSLKVSVDPCKNEISSLSYELRTLNAGTLVDSGTVSDFTEEEGLLKTELFFSDLINSGEEYHLVFSLELAGEKTVRYYTRVMYARTMHTDQLLEFSETFSQATYDREKAEFIVNYIQPNDTSETEDYYYTTLHSKYAVFTYGNLNVRRGEDISYRITELEPTQLSLTLDYTIEMEIDGEMKKCFVKEFFCTRYRSEKVYLLDYYRTVEQAFEDDKAMMENGRIFLGIGSGETQILNSDNDIYTVFIQNREIRSYNAKTNSMNRIFSFADEDDLTSRSSFDHHDMQIVKVSDEGDIDYMVYGYMNRGSYEGRVGICFYRYNASLNAAKRLFFMPVSESEQMLMMDLGTLAYVNAEDVCYLRYGDGIYSIDLKTGESVEVSIRAYPGTYAMNEKGNVVSWQEGSDLNYPERLVILNMDTQTTALVNAEENEFVKILDFIGDDIVYGFGLKEDSIIQANVDTQQLLNRILIASTDEKLTVRQDYEARDFFILGAEVTEKRVTIRRCVKESKDAYTRIDNDYLLLTQPIDTDVYRSSLGRKNSETAKRQYYIQIGTTTNHDSQYSEAVPSFEAGQSVNVIRLTHMQTGVYYVYGYGRLLAVESEINKAIDKAFSIMGVVVDDSLNYLWTRGTRDLAKTISIQQYEKTEEVSSLGASLQVLSAQEGIQLRRVAEDLKQGLSPFEILDRALGAGSAVNLYECTLQEVLYFINKGRPVMAVMGDDTACVICGYETDGIRIYFPETRETTVVDTRTAEGYFLKNNNSFISYK